MRMCAAQNAVGVGNGQLSRWEIPLPVAQTSGALCGSTAVSSVRCHNGNACDVVHCGYVQTTAAVCRGPGFLPPMCSRAVCFGSDVKCCFSSQEGNHWKKICPALIFLSTLEIKFVYDVFLMNKFTFSRCEKKLTKAVLAHVSAVTLKHHVF